ncbi:hypothetical protein KM043_009366 [Ampulex compressa]|nr:hypothetical protein KM043_009366 [Ampulex compressa]
MESKDPGKYPPTTKENKFDPLQVEVKHPGTAILLLQCQEQPVLLAAVAALAKFGVKSGENLGMLFDLEVVKSVVPLITHEDLFTRRFAGMLLAEMTVIASVRNFLMDSNFYVQHFTKVLMNEQDTFMQEFSSLILARLSKDAYGASQLLKHFFDANVLFERIQSPDPDVQKNNLDILYNLIQDPTGIAEIIKAKDFDLKLIYQLFASSYPEIQSLALQVIADLLARNKNERLQTLFRQSNGLEALLNFLENEEWRDLHHEVLQTLRLATDNPTTAELFDDIGGIRRMFKYIDEVSDFKHFPAAFDTIVNLANTANGRKALHSYGIIGYLLNALRDTKRPEIHEISCRGVGTMTYFDPAAKELTAANCIKNLFDVLKNESLTYTAKRTAAFALEQLLMYDIENCKRFVEFQGQNYLMWLIKQSTGKIPIEIQIASLRMVKSIAKFPSLRNILTTEDIIDAICTRFEGTCPSLDELKIACCSALSMICIDKVARDVFLKAHGPSRLYNLLCDIESIPVRNAAAQLVQQLCADPNIANAFVKSKYLSYMLNNRSAARIVPSWDTCIETLFNSHLPIKFAFTGRLSLHDVTQDGFYVLRRNTCPFPVLDDLFRFKFCPLEPIYVVNCTNDPLPESQDGASGEGASNESKNSIRRDSASKGIFLSAENVNTWLDLKFGRMQCDVYLQEYIEVFKSKLLAAEPKAVSSNTERNVVNISCIASRAKMLAQFVARQMSGPDPASKCMDHQLEIHLKEIKESIETSIIPLGLLRVGSYLERALLFKVIADKICLPAALVRGEYGKAWIEIAVAQIEAPEEETSFSVYLDETAPCVDILSRSKFVYKNISPGRGSNGARRADYRSMEKAIASLDHRRTVFPSKLMKPNFIVDLMDAPGDLIPIDSHRAKMYREHRLVCDTICCH